MNLRAFAGYYFFAAANATERANLFSSWGLLQDAPVPTNGGPVSNFFNFFWKFIIKKRRK